MTRNIENGLINEQQKRTEKSKNRLVNNDLKNHISHTQAHSRKTFSTDLNEMGAKVIFYSRD